MLIVQRQQKLLEILKEQRSAQLEDLSRVLGVSTSTARRDLGALEARGLVERTHGGAVYTGGPVTVPSLVTAPGLSGNGLQASDALAERLNERVEQKQAIGKYAASLVQPQMTLIMDGGSTVIFAARQISARPIQVVTNSLSIANVFADDEQVELVLIGGSLYPRTGVTVGPIATGCLAELHADLMMFSLAGIYGDECFNQNLDMAKVEQAMMQQAARSVLLMDSSKFGRKSLTRVCMTSEVDVIVTDSAVDPSWRQRLGERLVVAP
jgi:DeoR family fructose operon transcriptional repressor